MLKQLVLLAAGVGIGYYIHYQQTERETDNRVYESEQEFDARLKQARDDIELVLNEEYRKKVEQFFASQAEIASDIPVEELAVPMPSEARQAMVDYAGVTNKTLHVTGLVGLADNDHLAALRSMATKVDTPVADQDEEPLQIYREFPETDVEEFEEGEAPTRFELPSKSHVQIVDASAFETNGDDYTEYTIAYWAGNDVLTNVKDEPFTDENKRQILGREGLAVLKAGPEAMGGSELYIRHTHLKSVFEIIWHAGSYESEDA